MYKRKLKDDSNKENSPHKEKKIRQNDVDNEKNVCIVLSDNEEEDEKEVSNESIIDLSDKSEYQSESESESENETNPVTEVKAVEAFLKELDSNEEILSYQVLEKILKNTKQIGDFCVSGEATNLPSVLGLEIEGFGAFSLPLVKSVATSLIKLCSQAPYGHNFDTLVDKKVRDSYQLDPNKIKINNKIWPQKLNELVNKVCADLGVKGNVEAKLYKMLIYEKGGHFLKHRDTEKENGMFATLVLQLPSIHEGGELVVYNGNNKKVYDFGQSTGNAPYLIHYAAHYADLEHELLEVKSGYRTALIYSLCWKNGNGFCPNIKIDSNAQVSGYLNTLSKSNKRLAICLEHQYTPQSLKKHGLTALKGIDNDRFNLLSFANEQLPFDEQFSFYIAHVNLIIESYDVSGFEPYNYRYGYGCTDEDYEKYCEWEENDRTRKITCWYDFKGTKVFDSVRVDVNFFHKIISPSVKNLDLNDTKYWKVENNEIEGYTGNEGINKTTTYGKYLLAMWPKKAEFHVLLSMDLNSAIDSLVNHMPKQIDSIFIEKLSLTFNCLNENVNYLKTKSILNLMKILETYDNNLDKCKYLIEKCIKKMDLNFVKPICNLIKKYEWSNLNDSLKVLLERSISSYKENYFYPFQHTTSYNSIQINCNLAKTLFDDVSSSVASKFFNEFVIPFLNKLNPIPSSTDLILLIQTVNLFPSEQEIQLNKIKNGLMTIKDKKVLNAYLKELINSFSAECLKIFKEVFEHHIKSLNLNIKNQKEFSWQMPLASMPDHPQVEMFLKSNQESMIYSNVFNSIGHARNFANKHSSETFSYSNPGPKMYSVRMEADGRGSNAFVRITKTKNFFKNEMNELAKYKQDVKVFNTLLSKFNS